MDGFVQRGHSKICHAWRGGRGQIGEGVLQHVMSRLWNIFYTFYSNWQPVRPWLSEIFHSQLWELFIVMFEMVMMMNGCIVLWYNWGYCGLWHISDRGFSHVWQFVTDGREGVKFGQEKCDIFFEWPQTQISVMLMIIIITVYYVQHIHYSNSSANLSVWSPYQRHI